jgi:septum formation protein
MDAPELWLASNSPRRKQLLMLAGWTFRVVPANIDETQLSGELPLDYVSRLACSKAQALIDMTPPESLVVAADTIVVDHDKVLGKPSEAQEAVLMLQHLRDHTHQVFTALAVWSNHLQLMELDVCETSVPMRHYSDDEIQKYVASGDPLDKAGAYAIQHAGFHPVQSLDGCYASVMGLPLCHLVRLLHRFERAPHVNVPEACQAALDYSCPVYRSILYEIY